MIYFSPGSSGCGSCCAICSCCQPDTDNGAYIATVSGIGGLSLFCSNADCGALDGSYPMTYRGAAFTTTTQIIAITGKTAPTCVWVGTYNFNCPKTGLEGLLLFELWLRCDDDPENTDFLFFFGFITDGTNLQQFWVWTLPSVSLSPIDCTAVETDWGTPDEEWDWIDGQSVAVGDLLAMPFALDWCDASAVTVDISAPA